MYQLIEEKILTHTRLFLNDISSYTVRNYKSESGKFLNGSYAKPTQSTPSHYNLFYSHILGNICPYVSLFMRIEI